MDADYPTQAVEWLVGAAPARVLELGSGTGRLTRRLVELGHEVVVCDLSAKLLTALHGAVPQARRTLGRAETIPLSASTVDIVIAGRAFHRFDRERALPEIARVLRPGGALAVLWNSGDDKVPWVKRVLGLIDDPGPDPGDPINGSELFAPSDLKVFRHWQQFHRDSLMELAATSSRAAALTDAERADLTSAVGAIYDGYGRGPDGMLMPWKTYCYRSAVTRLANARRQTASSDLDAGLLIDFS